METRRSAVKVAVAGVGLLAALGVGMAIGGNSVDKPKPVVITDTTDRVIDMPAGVIWVVRDQTGAEMQVDF